MKTVTYLNNSTDFFDWLSKRENGTFKNNSELILEFGSTLLRNISQIATNASVILHWIQENSTQFPSEDRFVASALYPNVSMMNHSCKPNVSMLWVLETQKRTQKFSSPCFSYIDDTVIVRALEDLDVGDEVFNCYGTDYRFYDKDYRQKQLKELYFFECKCVICNDPSKEIV